VPLAAGVAEVAEALGDDPATFAAVAGEDFELLLCAPPRARDAIEEAAGRSGPGVSWIGEVTSGPGLELHGARATGGELRGFEHGPPASGASEPG
jgi:thiamine-monophosphate kinase